MIGTDRIEDWFAGGERVAVGGFELFTRVAGDEGAPWLTALHGFPTCSWDWSAVVDELAAEHRVLLFDFVGFGDSDKPREHTYTIHEQADLTEALWRHHRVERTALVVHDYGVSVGQELLARRAEGTLEAAIERIAFVNGGLYPDLHRPVVTQKLLLHPRVGPAFSRVVNERGFTRALSGVFAPEHRPSKEELHEHWLGIARRDGHRIQHLLIRYIEDRRRHAERWTGALERTQVPRTFVWGMRDPVSGAHMAERITQRVPARELHALADVGHYPQLEAPLRVRLLLREFLAG